MNHLRTQLLHRAETAKRESKSLDFKREFDPTSSTEWAEIIKDIVAFANSGGGVIVFGANDDGSSAHNDLSSILSIDLADITNKVDSATGYQFADMELQEVVREGETRAALVIGPADVPLVFIRPGADVIVKGRQKPAFAKGTVYFRHGAKSEPGNRDDLASWLQRSIEKVRRSWLGGIRKVIQAPPGSLVDVISPAALGDGTETAKGRAISARIAATPDGIKVAPRNAEEIWPYRQKELLDRVNKALKVSPSVNGFDILCINHHLKVLNEHPEYAYKPHRLASPQYSPQYAEWIIQQYRKDESFFRRRREDYRSRT